MEPQNTPTGILPILFPPEAQCICLDSSSTYSAPLPLCLEGTLKTPALLVSLEAHWLPPGPELLQISLFRDGAWFPGGVFACLAASDPKCTAQVIPFPKQTSGNFASHLEIHHPGRTCPGHGADPLPPTARLAALCPNGDATAALHPLSAGADQHPPRV
ncbi:hypothetical protein PAPYR_10662 [Paratrimastix pyriformis]|uniref:Uncharacterized protein n=1 Tax=Paratrimastix pyriformis TaxID=342808 RepID=A0ABQ8UB44_9EUKA|nr:hypothetical protein PAPYR_10662 [Paratrimastix pyriformis]